MPIYDVKVVVEYMYEVEADNEAEAEEQGWMYEDYAYSGEVYSIKVDEQEEDEEDEEDNLDEEVI
jgi:proline racemase